MVRSGFDLAIVGGGIVGAMLAWRAWKRRPQESVLWLDRSLLGQGASAYSGGLITPYGRSEHHRVLAALSARLLQELAYDLGSLPVRKLQGWFITAAEKTEETRGWFVSGDVKTATAEDLESLRGFVPDLSVAAGEVVLGPLPMQQGWPSAMIQRIATLCRNHGRFSIWEGIEVVRWTALGDRVQLTFSSSGTVEARNVVFATGPWQHQDGLALPDCLRVKKVAAFHLETPPVESAPVILFGDYDAFLLPLPEERRWLFSFPSPVWGVTPDPSGLALDESDVHIAGSILQRYAPKMDEYRRGGRVFCDSYTHNRAPLTCHLAGCRNVVYAGGCSGSGFRLAPGIAEHALNLLDGHSLPTG